MTTVPGLTVTTVADQIYGTLNGDPVLDNPERRTINLPAGSLIPVGFSDGRALVVGAPHTLYALTNNPR